VPFFPPILNPGKTAAAIALLVVALKGCPSGSAPPASVEESTASAGVSVRKIAVENGSHVRVIDADLTAPGVRVEIAADDIARREGRVTGAARSVPEWVEQTGAFAGVNGGFFGHAAGPSHLEIVGLLKVDGRVRSAAPSYQADSGERYARSALGLERDGTPSMAWVTSRPGDPQSLFAHPEPVFRGRGTRWEVEAALACGPRLIREGQPALTFRAERLASPGSLPRTFIGFGGRGERPERFVMCAATGMEFEECAEFLQHYFQEAHGMACREAMCLDGGSSTQAAWRENGAVRAETPFSIGVPTAVLVYNK
jgi:hypothetical protein